jgi:hypothetical protein
MHLVSFCDALTMRSLAAKLGSGTKKAHSCVSCFRKEKASRMKPSEWAFSHAVIFRYARFVP